MKVKQHKNICFSFKSKQTGTKFWVDYNLRWLLSHLLWRSVCVELTFHKANGGAFFLRNGERPLPVGSLFKQPILAQTLRRLAEKGIEDFYLGRIAASICEDMQANNGFIQKDDLANIPKPIEREPLSCRFGNMDIRTMPPPGAGRTLVEMLNILRKFPGKTRNPDTPEGALLLAEVIRRAQLDRRDRPFDPNFYPQVQERQKHTDSFLFVPGYDQREWQFIHAYIKCTCKCCGNLNCGISIIALTSIQ